MVTHIHETSVSLKGLKIKRMNGLESVQKIQDSKGLGHLTLTGFLVRPINFSEVYTHFVYRGTTERLHKLINIDNSGFSPISLITSVCY